MKYLSFFLLPIALSLPFLAFANHNGWRGGCYESRSMCEDIEDLGDDEIDEFPTPLFLDVTSDELVDTWGEARSSGNTHEGTDIFAPKGAYIVMPVDGVVDRADTSGLGGKHVFVYIAGGEKLYFAHLDDWAEDLDEGDVLEKGDLVGYVGNTGAEWARDHLHFTVYKDGEADNAFPRMEGQDWDLDKQMDILDNILDDLSSSDAEDEARNLWQNQKYRSIIQEAIDEEIDIPDDIEDYLEEMSEELELDMPEPADAEAAEDFEIFETDLSFGMNSAEVERLQEFLNDVEDADIEESGEFDSETLEAVKDFQEKYSQQVLDVWGLDEATGYVGITTRLRINFMIQANDVQCPVFDEYNSRTTNPNGEEVEETEELLKDLGFFTGDPDEQWDYQTHLAMTAFQERFAATMLTPWGISQGTGYKYKTTNKFMNYLRGCDTASVYLEGQGNFDF